MTLVRIIKDYQDIELLRQTPNRSGVWEGIQFTLDPVQHCDYVVVLNRNPEDTVVECPSKHIWALIQEPPEHKYRWYFRGLKYADRIFTQDTHLKGPRYVHSHGALPWRVGKSYDELVNAPVPEKTKGLSWVTSNRGTLVGHHHRLDFLDRIRKDVEFDLWGRNYTPIADKWDGLAPYRYSLAIENFSNPYYWSEKAIDCFLSWTMPIYYGCTNLKAYFPEESFITIDIRDPDVSKQINDIIKSNCWKESLEAIAYARELVLNQHQMFPFVTKLVHQEQENSAGKTPDKPQPMILKGVTIDELQPPLDKFNWWFRRKLSRLSTKLRRRTHHS